MADNITVPELPNLNDVPDNAVIYVIKDGVDYKTTKARLLDGVLSQNTITVTYTQLQTLIQNNALVPNSLYEINEVDPALYGGTTIYLKAISNNQLETNGVAKFIVPKYNQAVAGSGVYDRLGATTYAINGIVFWGGRVWKCINNTITNYESIVLNDFSLDSSKFQVQPYSDINYKSIFVEITYNQTDNEITSVFEIEGNNYVEENVAKTAIKGFQWGNPFNGTISRGIGSQKITDNSWNININFAGLFQYNLTFSNNSGQFNLTFSNNSYQNNLTFSNNSYQHNLRFSNNSFQNNLTFSNNSGQANLTFNSSYQNYLTFSNNSYQNNLTFINDSYQENLTFDNYQNSSFTSASNLVLTNNDIKAKGGEFKGETSLSNNSSTLTTLTVKNTSVTGFSQKWLDYNGNLAASITIAGKFVTEAPIQSARILATSAGTGASPSIALPGGGLANFNSGISICVGGDPHASFDNQGRLLLKQYSNISSIDASAHLQLDSTIRGFLPPRMTNAQRIAITSPAVGLMVYCTDAVEGVYVNTSTGWKSLTMV